MPGVSPAWAQPTRLLQAGVVDFRVLTDLLVDLNVDKRVCPAPNVLSNVYQGDVAQKCAAATAVLGDSKMGFGIKPPVLPRALLTACYAHCLSIVFRFDFYVAVLLAVEGASRWPMLRTFPLLLSQHWSERGLLSQHRRVREDHSASHTFTSRSAALRGCRSSCTGID